jgi:hypothetical protein
MISLDKHGFISWEKKSKTLKKFKEFKLSIEKKIREPIKSLRFDRGGEYTSIVFIKFCKKNDIP